MSIKLVIFDLDGVLVDSKRAWGNAWIAAFASLGRKISFDDFERNCWGVSFKATCLGMGFSKAEHDKAKEAG